MPHLDKIGFENFRVFGERTFIDLHPITILTGTNSSGKSSVLKGLQLLQANSKDLNVLNFGKGNHKLGNFDLAVHKKHKNKVMSFAINDKYEPSYILIDAPPTTLNLTYQVNESDNMLAALEEIKIIGTEKNESFIEISKSEGLYVNVQAINREILSYFIRIFIMQYEDYLIALNTWDSSVSSNMHDFIFIKCLDFFPYTEYGKEILHKFILSKSIEEKKKLIEQLKNNSDEDYFIYQVKSNFLGDTIRLDRFAADSKEDTKIEEGSTPFFFNEYIPLTPDELLQPAILGALLKLKPSEIEDSTILHELYDTYETTNLVDISKRIESKILYVRKINYEILTKIFTPINSYQDFIRFFFNNIFCFKTNEKKLTQINKNIKRGKLSKHLEKLNQTGEFKTILESSIQIMRLITLRDTMKTFNIIKFEKSILTYNLFDDSRLISLNPNYILESFVSRHMKDLESLERTSIITIGAVRGETQRMYLNKESSNDDLNHTLSYFLRAKQSQKNQLITRVNSMLIEVFGIDKKLNIEVNGPNRLIEIQLGNENLADIGFGMTQLIPILLQVAIVAQSDLEKKKNNADLRPIIYLEEPESNLHPKFQSKIADLAVYIYKNFYIQLIIETHSEYLIRKLQYLTANKTILTNYQTSIYYFYHPEEERPVGEPQIKKIKIQEDGRLSSPFGSGFYDESTRLMNAIFTGETLN